MSDHFDSDRVNADEQRVRALLSAVDAPAPGPLRARIAELNAAPPSRRRLRLPALAFGGAFATAAAAAALVVVLTAGTSAPTALRTAAIALAQPRGSAPARLVATGTQIAFPDWTAAGWPSAGVRHEFYRARSSTIGYSIVSGSALRWGSGGHTVLRSHAEYRLLRAGGARIVAWVQDGHTCVIASRSAPGATLLSLAIEQDSTATVSAPMGWASPQQLAARA